MRYDIDANEILSKVFEDFDEGNIDGLDAYLYVKKLDTIIKGIKANDDILDDARGEVERHGKG